MTLKANNCSIWNWCNCLFVNKFLCFLLVICSVKNIQLQAYSHCIELTPHKMLLVTLACTSLRIPCFELLSTAWLSVLLLRHHRSVQSYLFNQQKKGRTKLMQWNSEKEETKKNIVWFQVLLFSAVFQWFSSQFSYSLKQSFFVHFNSNPSIISPKYRLCFSYRLKLLDCYLY